MIEDTVKHKNGYLTSMDDLEKGFASGSSHTKPPPSQKIAVFPKTFLQIILAAKSLVQHSSVCPPTISDDLCLNFLL